MGDKVKCNKIISEINSLMATLSEELPEGYEIEFSPAWRPVNLTLDGKKSTTAYTPAQIKAVWAEVHIMDGSDYE